MHHRRALLRSILVTTSSILGASAAILAGCAASPDPRREPPREVDPGPVASSRPADDAEARRSAPTAPAETSSASVAASAAPRSPSSGPHRVGAPGSTRGTVSCGATRCRVPGETCVLDPQTGAFGCAPTTYDASVKDGEVAGFACDDGTDCPKGMTCCSRFDPPSLDELSACVARKDVVRACRAELCDPAGAACPPGQTCVVGDDGGSCEPPKGPATCAGRRPCPADKPICAVSAKGAACVAKGSPEYAAVPGDRRYECTRDSDCHGGDLCSFAFGEIEHETGTYCSKYSFGMMGTKVCDPKGPSLCGADAACRKSHACVASEPLLPWLGAWTTP